MSGMYKFCLFRLILMFDCVELVGTYQLEKTIFLQGFSGMNRFNQSTWSKVQCEMILAFLSFADYFRPKYFLLENVRNFVSFNKGQTFRLTVASLLEMGYQVGYGLLLMMEMQLLPTIYLWIHYCVYT